MTNNHTPLQTPTQRQHNIGLNEVNELHKTITKQPADYIQLTYKQYRNLINLLEGMQEMMGESVKQWLTAND